LNFLRKRSAVAAVGAVAALLLAGCAQETTVDPSATAEESLTIYSGRNEELIAPLLDIFTQETGIQVSVRYGDSAELAAQILEEGDNRQADVFFSQDAGALGALSAAGLLQDLGSDLTSKVPAEFRADDNTWVGISGRARVFSYSPERVTTLPTSVLDLMDPSWKGRIGIAPTNASFQAFVTGLRVLKGEQVATDFLAAMKTNAVIFDKNSAILEAVEAGQIDAGLINHYYWYERAAEVGTDKMTSEIAWFTDGDPGNLINVAGVGLLTDKSSARTFAEWLLGETAQKFFVNNTFEYALIPGIPAAANLPELLDIKSPAIDLSDLATLSETLELITEAGLI
jgi:iron(III) transport system substrate-binding protein